ncbi:MAG: undecaprenyl-phosphate glucose phosphotransferase [Geminicoccaceae bacterium]|nr:undecaprenyl-phosphate glucose phosphotransferase [Geminicoccaceae bacterium]
MNDGEVEIRRPPAREELDRPVAVRGGDWLAPEIVVGVARAGDALLVLASGALVAAIGGFAPLGRSLLAWAMLTGLLFALCFWQLFGAYDEGLRLSMRARSVRVLSGWATALVALVVLVRLTGSEELVPGAWLLAWGASAATGLLVFRAILGALERRWRRQGRLLRNVVVLGAGELGQRFVREVRRRDPSVRLIGLFDDRRDRVPQFVGGFPVLGTLDDLLLFARRHRVDEIVIALPWSAEGRILECLKKLRGLPCDVRLASDLVGFHLPSRGLVELAGLPMFTVFERPLSPVARLVKAIEDRLLAFLLLLILAPLMGLIALAIKASSPGPVFYRQKRGGFNGEVFEVLKFRTMRADACDRGTETGLGHTRPRDPRVTAIGRFLRRTSLDELPQLFNVLKGDMSLVGPRPHAVAHDHRYAALVDGYLARHRVKPGITGLAQIRGCRGEIRSLADMQRRIELDLEYIQRWSLRLDLEILIRTVLHGLWDPRAY